MAQETQRGRGQRTQGGHKDTSGTREHRGNVEGDAEGTCHKTGWNDVVADKPSLESQVGDYATRTMKEGIDFTRSY